MAILIKPEIIMSKETHEMKVKAIEEINRLAKANGGKITPAQLVAIAADPNNPLHEYFEWDDSAAANKYREVQARILLRSVRVDYIVNNRKISIPKYVRDPELDSMSQGYVETARIRNDADLTRDILITEFKRIGTALTRARKLAEYFDLTAEIDNMTESLGLLRKRLDEVAHDGLNG